MSFKFHAFATVTFLSPSPSPTSKTLAPLNPARLYLLHCQNPKSLLSICKTLEPAKRPRLQIRATADNNQGEPGNWTRWLPRGGFPADRILRLISGATSSPISQFISSPKTFLHAVDPRIKLVILIIWIRFHLNFQGFNFFCVCLVGGIQKIRQYVQINSRWFSTFLLFWWLILGYMANWLLGCSDKGEQGKNINMQYLNFFPLLISNSKKSVSCGFRWRKCSLEISVPNDIYVLRSQVKFLNNLMECRWQSAVIFYDGPHLSFGKGNARDITYWYLNSWSINISFIWYFFWFWLLFISWFREYLILEIFL